MRRLSNVAFALTLLTAMSMAAHLDVRLRMNQGEVVGWVSVTRSRDSEGNTRYSAAVEPLVYSSTAPREFRRFSSNAGGRLYAACQARGLDPIARRFPNFREAVRQPANQALGRMGIDPSRVTWGPRQVLCRLRYAGLFRHVVYDFEEFRPEDEARLRQGLQGGRFPGGSMRGPAPDLVPR